MSEEDIVGADGRAAADSGCAETPADMAPVVPDGAVARAGGGDGVPVCDELEQAASEMMTSAARMARMQRGKVVCMIVIAPVGREPFHPQT